MTESINTKIFPKDFLWGASASAFQIEGRYENDGKGLATTDLATRKSGMADTDTAADFVNHYKEDITLMKEMGLKIYRMGFSWSRIMPDETMNPNPEGLAFYDKVIDALLAAGIEPFVTLYHFECPQALVEAFGGWKSRKMIDHYTAYAKICFTHFKGRVKKWATVNEQLIAASAPDLNGNFEKDPHLFQKNIWQMHWHISVAEHKAFALLKKIDPQAVIGPVCSIQVVYPLTCSPADVEAAAHAEELMEFSLLDLSARGKWSPYVVHYLKSHDLYPTCDESDAEVMASRPDFIGVNYYFSICAKEKTGPVNYNLPPFWVSDAYDIAGNPYLEKTEWMNMGIDPDGLKNGIEKIILRYSLPDIITGRRLAGKGLLSMVFH